MHNRRAYAFGVGKSFPRGLTQAGLSGEVPRLLAGRVL